MTHPIPSARGGGYKTKMVKKMKRIEENNVEELSKSDRKRKSTTKDETSFDNYKIHDKTKEILRN